MISLLVSGQSFIRVKDRVTELTLICEGVGVMDTLNVIPGVSFRPPRELITNDTHESRAWLSDVLIKVLRLGYCRPLKRRLYNVLSVMSDLMNSEWSACFECFATRRRTLVSEGVGEMLALNVVSGVSSAAAGKCKANWADKLAISLCNELVKVLWLFNRTFNKERIREVLFVVMCSFLRF